MALAAGAALGLAGSVHCLAMCGPLVVTFARAANRSRAVQLRHALTYHAGRVLVYAALGLVAGTAGAWLMATGLGRGLAVACGALLIAAGASRFELLGGRLARPWAAPVAAATAAAHRWSVSRPLSGPLVTGALNGLLPCGLTYAALTAAVAMGGQRPATLFMLGFGLGTVPALLAASLTASALPHAIRARLRRVAPVALAVLGALLIARGLVPQDHAKAGAAVVHRH
ncbi:MAG TPA: sulfite exporter TauE/SafE family protein [Vicinamibacterales bacterium]|nr:sulfite exporter TauE/SafE family protein [Vicinamibacterales bacterium]